MDRAGLPRPRRGASTCADVTIPSVVGSVRPNIAWPGIAEARSDRGSGRWLYLVGRVQSADRVARVALLPRPGMWGNGGFGPCNRGNSL